MIHKYGLPLTDSDWAGFPVRVGHFPKAGRLENLVCNVDSVLLWRGGPSEVKLACRFDGSKGAVTHTFERRGGMIDLLPRGTVLEEVTWQGAPDQNCISVNFTDGALRQLLGPDEARFSANGSPVFAQSDAHVVDLIGRLQDQAVAGSPLGASYAQGLSLTLASYLFARHGREPVGEAQRRGLPRLQSEALVAFVEDFLGRDIGLVDMAGVVGYSADHFARLFRETFNVSPHQYLITRRVERAKAMLRDRNLSIASVASVCGFAGQSHLSTVFKQRTGMTPGQYRKG